MRLIDADAFSEQYGNYYAEQGPEEGFIGTVGELIAKQPTIEPEVRHGRWDEIGGYEPENHGFACSVCDFATTVKSRFCPNCGAKMDEADTNVSDIGCSENDT